MKSSQVGMSFSSRDATMIMDTEPNGADSSLGRRSFRFSNAINPIDDDKHDVESGIVVPSSVDSLTVASPALPSSTLEIMPPPPAEAIDQCDDKKPVSSSRIFLSSDLFNLLLEREFCIIVGKNFFCWKCRCLGVTCSMYRKARRSYHGLWITVHNLSILLFSAFLG